MPFTSNLHLAPCIQPSSSTSSPLLPPYFFPIFFLPLPLSELQKLISQRFTNKRAHSGLALFLLRKLSVLAPWLILHIAIHYYPPLSWPALSRLIRDKINLMLNRRAEAHRIIRIMNKLFETGSNLIFRFAWNWYSNVLPPPPPPRIRDKRTWWTLSRSNRFLERVGVVSGVQHRLQCHLSIVFYGLEIYIRHGGVNCRLMAPLHSESK